MSRWLEQFKNHAFWPEWNALKSELGKAEIDDETVLTSVQELARLKKVVKYLDGLMAAIDSELVPEATWTSFHQQCVPCKQELMNFNSNKNIAHLKAANNHADNLLSYVKPWVVLEPSDAAKSMVGALEEYNIIINKYSDKYREGAKVLVSDLAEIKSSSEKVLADMANLKENIKTYSSELFDDSEDRAAIKTDIDRLVVNFEEENEKIHSFYIKLLEGSDDEESVSSRILKAHDTVESYLEQSTIYLDSIKNNKAELEIFHKKIFGVLEADGKPKTKGLKEEIETGMADLKSFDREQKLIHKALNEQIESLLPGATSAGLASAFKTMKESFKLPILGYTVMFYISLIFTMLVSVVAMTDTFTWNEIIFVKFDNVKDFLNSLGWKVPVVGAAIWLAMFSSKRRSEAQRLQQEYAHKESFASSYNSFKQQIEDLGDDDSEMLKILIVKAVDSISYNASATLDGKHGDKAPVHELIGKVLREIKDIKDVGLK